MTEFQVGELRLLITQQQSDSLALLKVEHPGSWWYYGMTVKGQADPCEPGEIGYWYLVRFEGDSTYRYTIAPDGVYACSRATVSGYTREI